MNMMTMLKYEHTATILYNDPSDGSSTWEEVGTVACSSRPLDRLGFVLVLMDDYYEEDRYQFHNFRNRNGTVLYPFPDEPDGQVLKTMDVSVRLDPMGVVQGYSYQMRKAD